LVLAYLEVEDLYSYLFAGNVPCYYYLAFSSASLIAFNEQRQEDFEQRQMMMDYKPACMCERLRKINTKISYLLSFPIVRVT